MIRSDDASQAYDRLRRSCKCVVIDGAAAIISELAISDNARECLLDRGWVREGSYRDSTVLVLGAWSCHLEFYREGADVQHEIAATWERFDQQLKPLLSKAFSHLGLHSEALLAELQFYAHIPATAVCSALAAFFRRTDGGATLNANYLRTIATNEVKRHQLPTITPTALVARRAPINRGASVERRIDSELVKRGLAVGITDMPTLQQQRAQIRELLCAGRVQ